MSGACQLSAKVKLRFVEVVQSRFSKIPLQQQWPDEADVCRHDSTPISSVYHTWISQQNGCVVFNNDLGQKGGNSSHLLGRWLTCYYFKIEAYLSHRRSQRIGVLSNFRRMNTNFESVFFSWKLLTPSSPTRTRFATFEWHFGCPLVLPAISNTTFMGKTRAFQSNSKTFYHDLTRQQDKPEYTSAGSKSWS